VTRTSLLSYSCFFLLLVEVEKEEGIEVEGREIRRKWKKEEKKKKKKGGSSLAFLHRFPK